MSRDLRIDTTGFYHLSNRGVGLREVFLSHDDRIFFITLMCESAKHYDYSIHGYSLISNGYNILIETTKNNLSHIMKLLNGQYTSYFNRRYKRRGHLWEGRFRSWYIQDESFVLEILSYIEHLPAYTGSTTEKKTYLYASYRQFIGVDERLPCMYNSVVYKKFNTLIQIKEFFDKPIDIARINRIHKLLKKQNRKQPKRPKKLLKSLDPSDFDCKTKEQRDKKIYTAYKKGYSQAKIGIAVGISQQAVYKVIKKLSVI